ncbi:MAG: hypothetical protein RL319_871 [Actinomycetota bacterium]|jgi:multiple sugar transport system permease protein
MSKRMRINRSAIAGSVMVLPYLVLLLLFGIAPIVIAFVTSLQPSMVTPNGGFENYIYSVTEFRFWPAVINVLTFLGIYLPAMMIVVVGISLLLDNIKPKLNLPLRLSYIVPAALTGSLSVLIWYIMLEPSLSPYRDLLHGLGLTESGQIWRTGNLAFIFVMMAFFTGAGNWIVVQYGSLQSIPDDILEAAKIDGASQTQIAFRIKLPLISKYLVYMAVLVFAAGLQIFVEPQLISGSVFPGLAADWSLNQLSYTFAFASNNLSSAAALSILLLVFCAIAAVFVVFKTDFFEKPKKRLK